MREEEFVEEQVKNIFKVSKQLYATFRGIKKLTMKYLIKITKLKAKKKAADAERDLCRRREEADNKKKRKNQEKKRIKELDIVNKLNVPQSANAKSPNAVPQKSIISIINEENEKVKVAGSKQQRREQKGKREGEEAKKSKKEMSSEKRPEKEKEKDKEKEKEKEKGGNRKKSQRQPNTKQKEGEEGPKTGKILQKPVEPESPYYRFLRMKRNQIRSSMSNIPMEKTSQIMKTIWDKMSDDEKREYVKSYEVDKAKYEREVTTYYAQLNTMAKNKSQDKPSLHFQTISDFDFIDQLDKM